MPAEPLSLSSVVKCWESQGAGGTCCGNPFMPHDEISAPRDQDTRILGSWDPRILGSRDPRMEQRLNRPCVPGNLFQLKIEIAFKSPFINCNAEM